ncbi:MAG: hypothetical protein UU48_C0009G0010 [Candidatus Uhrbacteria bacterium GW2011_GWF2_41_16]|uniref:Integral membrane protein n=2 Tax=Candidatus Uhriibacteriota TaxID=1752732 RepID=A0A0G0V9P0_9BACT|nr:MAG: hypothetical protein UU35_C0011G0008 [Candidatus Uhrbacteria bacterium GW2011_GWC2_41_11]KKR97738.1 MAG: hypothetical protein UU48_C0009G0010 [Candidatus Uhrbacteria bacterium GW2011_GWF2_41_16]
MKKNAWMFGLFSNFLLVFVPLFVYAQTEAADTVKTGLAVTAKEAGFGTESQSIYDLIAGVINVLLGFLGIIIFLFIVYAGYLYLTSQGADEKIKQAKKILSSSLTGAVIIISAYALSSYILGALATAVSK